MLNHVDSGAVLPTMLKWLFHHFHGSIPTRETPGLVGFDVTIHAHPVFVLLVGCAGWVIYQSLSTGPSSRN